MKKRFMRIVVFFDLPVGTSNEQREYRHFRKFLIRDGYIMMQESVYSKLAINQASANLCIERLKKSKPKKGLVQVLKVTERQYADMEYIVDSVSRKEIDTIDRLVIL